MSIKGAKNKKQEKLVYLNHKIYILVILVSKRVEIKGGEIG